MRKFAIRSLMSLRLISLRRRLNKNTATALTDISNAVVFSYFVIVNIFRYDRCVINDYFVK